MTAAKAAPELMLKTATATAMASSKLLLAAVKASVAVFGYPAPALCPMAKLMKKHHNEIDQQRNGYTDHIQGNLDDQVSLETEHDHNGEEQGNQGNGADLGDERGVIPLFPFGFAQRQTRSRWGVGAQIFNAALSQIVIR